MRFSCQRKKELVLFRQNNNLNLKKYYKQYCKVLSKVILASKKLHYNKVILNSKNKIKSTWRFINKEKGKSKCRSDIQTLNINNNVISNKKEIATIFSNYYLSIADTINDMKGDVNLTL